MSNAPTLEGVHEVWILYLVYGLGFAGVWGHVAAQPGRASRGLVELEQGDVEEGLRAAAAIGDDRIQRMSTGRVFPDKFPHGSAAQRVEWFRRGLEAGQPNACDTFGGGT